MASSRASCSLVIFLAVRAAKLTGQQPLCPEEVLDVLTLELRHDEPAARIWRTKPWLVSANSPSRTGVLLTPMASAMRSMRRNAPGRTTPDMISSRT